MVAQDSFIIIREGSLTKMTIREQFTAVFTVILSI